MTTKTSTNGTGSLSNWANSFFQLFSARAVVLASGDYAANSELKARFISPAVSKVDAMNPTATGDGHLMAFPLGAHLQNLGGGQSR